MSKSTLMLMRHAKAEGYTGADTDKARPLAAQGDKDADRIGKWMAQQGLMPDIVLCSPAVRTRQTIAAVNRHLQLADDHIIYSDAIYNASLDDLLDLIDQYRHECNAILVIGHNPGMDELLCFLSETQPPMSDTGKLMATATVAVLDYDDGRAIQSGSAKARLLMRPKELPKSV
ncbi:MAG: SixA phosphatase family protein [Gammaproteobacteria bacterium]